METTSVPSTVIRQHQTNHAAPTPTNRSEPPRVAITFSFPPVLARNPRILEFASYPFGAAGIFCMANHRYVAGLSLLAIFAGLAGTSAFIRVIFEEHHVPEIQERLRRLGRLP
ncbi:hypothetical protein AAKU67_000417 [Oxalobacteraceae bacterium GrIS 2.11]